MLLALDPKTNMTKALPTLRRLLALFVCALQLPIAGRSAAGAGPKDLPKPTDYVSDFAHVLSPRAVKEVDRVCAQLDHSNADAQIAVVTIPSIDGADIANFARELANTWGVGRKETDRGVLVLLAINDHKWRIAVGYGLERILPNSKMEAIGADMLPQLRANDFDDAVMLVVHEIAQAISDATQASRSDSSMDARRSIYETGRENGAYCCSTTWSPSLRPEMISVTEPLERPTVTGTLRKPSF